MSITFMIISFFLFLIFYTNFQICTAYFFIIKSYDIDIIYI
ncbi:hypothetical protein HMPREF9970_2813 [Lachnoanaerobaculum saburreum F0468]|uniref:Uncharacterized protein n=1 Tax=Lachnoanaerobaculum saburreum F0468 TaxID=1095750 RepID=I0R3T0_9FIRM|nr:hypothetical protein HMPREF9970_2813 [Lachnoanaerobaculum saburreum F0468]